MTPRQRPPERLEKTLARVAREQGVDQERLRRWVSFLAICGALERATAQGLLPGYSLKGGVAMELRSAQRARATKDFDLVLDGDRRTRLRSFEQALGLGFDQFDFRVKARRIFQERATHDFPPKFEVPPTWRPEWESLAGRLGFGAFAVADIEAKFRETIQRIASSPV